MALGDRPIPNLTNVIEAHGVRVVQMTIRDGWFDGLACRVDEHPVVVVGADWPGDRQRFTLAHELGHLVLDGDWRHRSTKSVRVIGLPVRSWRRRPQCERYM